MKLSTKDCISLFSRLARLLQAGITLAEAFDFMRTKHESGRIYEYLFKQISNGKSFADSLVAIRGVSPEIRQFISIGEQRGVLSHSCEHTARVLSERADFQRTLIGAIIYPLLILFLCVALLLGMFILVIPQMMNIFSSMKIVLPMSTRILIFLHNLLVSYWFVFAICFACLSLSLIVVWRYDRFKYFFEYVLLRIPIVGPMIRSSLIIHFFDSIALLMSTGTSLVESIDANRNTSRYVVMRRVIGHVYKDIVAGKQFSDVLLKYPYIFDHMSVQMIRAGEFGGGIRHMTVHVSVMHKKTLTDSLMMVSRLAEPLLMIMIGIVTGCVAIALISPLYEITSSLHVR